jgi:hypothetical protein
MVHMANCGPNTKGAMFPSVDKIVGSDGAPSSSNADTQLVEWMLRQLDFFGAEGELYSGTNDARRLTPSRNFNWPTDRFRRMDKRASRSASPMAQTRPRIRWSASTSPYDKFRFTGWPHLNQMPNRIMAPQVFRRPAELLGNRSDGG